MKVLRQLTELAGTAPAPCLAIGVFDGVHRGHQQVIQTAIRHAAANNGQAVVLTFDPHPARVLRPDTSPRILTATTHKLKLLAGLGVDACLLLTFDARLAETPASDFITHLARTLPGLQEICVGERFRFGYQRQGDVALIQQLARDHGYQAFAVPSVTVDGATISSTAIRQAITEGDLKRAASFLGRPFSVLGTVQEGDRIGHELGFPTANLDLHGEVMPPNGVYAVRVTLNGHRHGGVVNIGTRPTIDPGDRPRRLEVHLLDFEGDLYGQDLEAEFVGWIRDEHAFPDRKALGDQIRRDILTTRRILTTV